MYKTMGCLYTLLFKPVTSTECLMQLKAVEALLQEMLKKYERQHTEILNDIKQSLREKEDKQILLHKLRRKKRVLHYMESTRRKIQSLIQKQYALEQLNITKLQLNAIKETVKVFKIFNKSHSLEKIEDLQDTLEELTTQFMDVDATINSEQAPLIQFDDAELEQELELLANEKVDFPVIPVHEVELTVMDQTTAELA